MPPPRLPSSFGKWFGKGELILYNEEYYIWAQLLFSQGSRLPAEAFTYFKGAKELFDSNEKELRLSGLFDDKQLSYLLKKDLSAAQKVQTRCAELGIDIITTENPRYPKRLKHLQNYPIVLYVLGTFPDFENQPAIGIVGTRDATPRGMKVTSALSNGLAKAGAIVISGGAIGIDAAAHTGTLEAGGITVMVIACGLDIDYPKTNRHLKEVTVKNGAIVSEYPPGMSPTRFSFPVRNRIISGLSLGIVVVEAGEKSGSIITATHAAEQGRDVFVVPGTPLSVEYKGSEKLISDGAVPVYSAYDILIEYAPLFPHKLNLNNSETPVFETSENIQKKEPEPVEIREEPENLSPLAKSVLEVFEKDSLELDIICDRSGFETSDCLCALTELEISGLIISVSGNKYRRA